MFGSIEIKFNIIFLKADVQSSKHLQNCDICHVSYDIFHMKYNTCHMILRPHLSVFSTEMQFTFKF